MHFVHVEDFVHPNAGYQINLLTKLQVQQGHDVTIVTGEMDKMPMFLTSFFGKENIDEKDRAFEQITGVKIIRHPIYKYYSGRAIFKHGLHKKIKALNPDVLFIHNEDTVTGMKLLWDYKKMNVPYVLDCHMLEMASENRFKEYFRWFFRQFVTPVIINNNIPLIRVVDTDFVQKHYNIPLDKTHLFSFGTDTDYYKPDETNRKSFRKELNLGEKDFVTIYAGKLDASKGGLFLAEAIKNKINLKDNRKHHFIIVGNHPKDEYGSKVEELFNQSENHIIRFPTQTYLDLNKFYQVADIAIFPKQCSMSYFEAQASSLPVVLERNEINIERISNDKGLLFEVGSKKNFIDAIMTFGNMPDQEFSIYQQNARNNIIKNYNFVTIVQKFTDLMIGQYNLFHNK